MNDFLSLQHTDLTSHQNLIETLDKIVPRPLYDPSQYQTESEFYIETGRRKLVEQLKEELAVQSESMNY